ncbi:MAG: hypothetical protein WCJ29_06120 [bacterium]
MEKQIKHYINWSFCLNLAMAVVIIYLLVLVRTPLETSYPSVVLSDESINSLKNSNQALRASEEALVRANSQASMYKTTLDEQQELVGQAMIADRVTYPIIDTLLSAPGAIIKSPKQVFEDQAFSLKVGEKTKVEMGCFGTPEYSDTVSVFSIERLSKGMIEYKAKIVLGHEEFEVMLEPGQPFKSRLFDDRAMHVIILEVTEDHVTMIAERSSC